MFNLETEVVLAVGIFIITYVIIMSEKLNRTAVALVGAVILLLFNIITQEEAVHHIDFNTIGLLMGMMIIVNIMKRSGVFEYIAIVAAKKAKGDPLKILILFAIITAISSAFLDNVTTILLIVPVTMVITDALKISPVPILVPMILFANIGGTATLIGDPPNIMIGSATGLGFNDFLLNLAPVVIIIFIATLFVVKVLNKKSLHVSETQKAVIMKFDESLAIKDTALLKKSLAVLALTVLGFITDVSMSNSF